MLNQHSGFAPGFKEFCEQHKICLTVKDVIDGLALAKKKQVPFESLFGFEIKSK